ncbi:G-type lectin S-receptor-like serine/threonine-protein kinase At5g24080 [Prosopis cineraria]|uniref:G-type lectin S-receptor-like serine/threonine-protein kinase At5g24080 n=1 Tax=Prosopis cineraria TaxID=364024 RepID=UPI00240F3215|nr:G-type lectin S-receptor-like serine/threonine-protein kinase At5g24080 [Prosopis cineraria]
MSSLKKRIIIGTITSAVIVTILTANPSFRVPPIISILVGTTAASTIIIVISWVLIKKYKHQRRNNPAQVADEGDSAINTQFVTYRVDRFLNDIEKEKPIRFSSKHLMLATNNYNNILGSGGFGAVYKGALNDGTIVAVKVLHAISNKRIEEQFMAEVGTIGRVHHFNLVRLFGFCFEKNMRALVYEYMSNGSLDKYLLGEKSLLAFEKLHEIAVGTAKGIAYLHEECQQRIIHYDIKPENILLDQNFCPKVADFGLAKLYNREKSHITVTGLRGTPGYAAPELWMPFPITHKCDIYSFGMLLFEIISRRRNVDKKVTESEQWFPKLVWINFECGKLKELIALCGIEEKDKEMAERMIKIALWCVQYKSDLRPMMSDVVKMLEGLIDIPECPSNPFQHLMDDSVDSSWSLEVTKSQIDGTAPIMRKCEIEINALDGNTSSLYSDSSHG